MLIGLLACAETDQYSLHPHEFVYSFYQHQGQLIDVSSKEEWEAEHLPGAIHLNVSDPEAFKVAINRLNRQQAYYLYCNNGSSSIDALRFMRNAGFAEVYLLQGGLHSLKKEGYSVAGF